MESEELSQPSLLRNFTHIVIPAEIWHVLKSHPILERLINYYFMKTPLDLDDWKILKEKGLAEKISWSPYDISTYLKSKKPQLHSDKWKMDFPKCSWCHSTTFRLHHHHYPLSKSNGGKMTVPICPSCHDEYHYLQDCGYVLKQDTIRAFETCEGSNE